MRRGKLTTGATHATCPLTHQKVGEGQACQACAAPLSSAARQNARRFRCHTSCTRIQQVV